MGSPKAYGQSLPDGDMGQETDTGVSGLGVQQEAEPYDAGEDGYKCLGQMPVTGGFFTRESKHGQP